MGRPAIDLVGRVFGRLTIVERAGSRGAHHRSATGDPVIAEAEEPFLALPDPLIDAARLQADYEAHRRQYAKLHPAREVAGVVEKPKAAPNVVMVVCDRCDGAKTVKLESSDRPFTITCPGCGGAGERAQ